MAAKKRSSGSGSLKARKSSNKQQQILIIAGVVVALGAVVYSLNQTNEIESLPPVSGQNASSPLVAADQNTVMQPNPAVDPPANPPAQQPIAQNQAVASTSPSQTNGSGSFRPKRVRIRIQGIPPEQADGLQNTQDVVRDVFKLFGRDEGLLALIAPKYTPPAANTQAVSVDALPDQVLASLLKLTVTSNGKQKTGFGIVVTPRDVLVPAVLLAGAQEIAARHPLTDAEVGFNGGKTFDGLKELVLLQSEASLPDVVPARLNPNPVGENQYTLEFARQHQALAVKIETELLSNDESQSLGATWLADIFNPERQINLKRNYGLGLPVLDDGGNVVGMQSLCYALMPGSVCQTPATQIIRSLRQSAKTLSMPIEDLLVALNDDLLNIEEQAIFLVTDETMTDQGSQRLGKLRNCEFQIVSHDENLLRVPNLVSGTETLLGRELSRTEVKFNLQAPSHVPSPSNPPSSALANMAQAPVYQPVPEKYVSDEGNGIPLPSFDNTPAVPDETDSFYMIWSMQPDQRDPQSVTLVASMAVVDRDPGQLTGALLWSREENVATVTLDQLKMGQLPQSIGSSLTQMVNKFRSSHSRAVKSVR